MGKKPNYANLAGAARGRAQGSEPKADTAPQQATQKGVTKGKAPTHREGLVPVTAFVDPAVRTRLKIIAAEQGVTMDALLTTGINQILEENGSPGFA